MTVSQMRALRGVVVFPLALSTTAGAVVGAYLCLLTAAGSRNPLPPVRAARPSTRFVILVPAHNEALGIGATLQSLARLDYPTELFDVHVVADNCTDDTASVVRAHGWTAHERVAPEDPGKGPALNWLFDRLCADTSFDVVVIIDADTVADPAMLRAFDLAFTGGIEVAQGYYGVRAPESPPAAIRFAALACRHHLRAQGRSRLGASAGLYGNGMALRRSVLERHRWTGHLVEDAELQLELLLVDGTRVAYVAEARVAAEMPDNLAAATTQNARWERGRIELVRRNAIPLARSALLGRPARRVASVDALLDLLTPPLSVLIASRVTTLACNALLLTVTRDRLTRRRAMIDAITLMMLGTHVMIGLRSVSAPRSAYRSLAGSFSAAVWKVGLWLQVLRPRSGVSWQRTRRNAES